jgi:hypothetical protein
MFVVIIAGANYILQYCTAFSCTNSKKKNSSKALLVLRGSLVVSWGSRCFNTCAASILLDLDPPLGRGLSLRNDDGEDTILQAGLDGILVNALRERERTRKGADRTLRNPVVGLVSLGLLVLGNLLRRGSVGGFGRGNGARVFVFDGGLVGFVRAGGAFGLGIGQLLLMRSGLGFEEGGWAATLLSHSLSATANGERVGVGKFDVDVLLGDAREFAVQFVGVLVLLHVEARLETADALREGRAVGEAAVNQAGIVVHQAEQAVLAPERRSEVGIVGDEAWEEGHFVWCDECWDCVVVGLEGLLSALMSALDLSARALVVDDLFLL